MRESRFVADVILRGGDFGRPWIVPPGTPANLLKILRDAHAKAMADPALLDEAKKGKMEVQAVSGEELQKLADKAEKIHADRGGVWQSEKH